VGQIEVADTGRPWVRFKPPLTEPAQARLSRPDLLLLISNLELLLGAGIDLNAALAKIADYLSRFEKFRSDLISSLIYPAILLIMALAAIIILVTVVVPQFKPLFEDAGAELPLLTRLVVGSSDLVLDHALLLSAGPALLTLLARAGLKQPQIALALNHAKLGLPFGAGALLKKIEAARFTRLLALLLENGVGLLPALALIREAAGNRAFAAGIGGVAERVREGSRFTAALIATGLIPAAYAQVLEAGEEASQLETVLGRVAGIAERETETALKNFMAAFVPLLTILLGGFVAVIILSVLFALLSINDLALR
jgi:general secretion pathway protein F